jgi:ribosomal protein S12 methylthiotransferase
MERKPKFHIVNLGCAKNEVDAQAMAWLLQQAGYDQAKKVNQADLVIVNTCGFLQAAREESLQVVRSLVSGASGRTKVLAAGCLVQRSPEDFQGIRGLHGILSTREWPKIVSLADAIMGRTSSVQVLDCDYPIELPVGRSARGFSAYIKISEGCDAPCAFCIIPEIKGRLRSKPRELVLKECLELTAQGVKELVLVAQDTTAYGWDWGERDALPDLLHLLANRLPREVWIRLMYAYPGHVTPRLIEAMASLPQVCRYLDMPLQHASPSVLKAMRRPAPEHALRHIEQLRAAMPDIAIRTTFIVGFPGETEADFQELLGFLRTVRFDHVGVFTFSPEPGTPAAEMPDQVPEEVKIERRQRLMALQRQISYSKNRALEGAVLRVLIEGEGQLEEEGRQLPISAGRAARHAPEVDGLVLIDGRMPLGSFVDVKVRRALPYDLLAEPLPTAPIMGRHRQRAV